MSGARLKILVVDDDHDICTHFGEQLTENGFEVRCANSGNEAVQILETEDFNVIISDLMMPNGNGLKVRDHALLKGIPIIFATGFLEPYQTQVSDNVIVMEKPFSVEDLLSKLHLIGA